MENLTERICLKLVKKEGYIAIWQKPLNSSCYVNRQPHVQPLLCGSKDDPDNVWFWTADGYAFQDELGLSLEEIWKTVPGGSLIFFPSYRLMEKLCNRWCETGQWARLNARKPLFVEPRGQDDFESALTGYSSAIWKSQTTLGRKRRTTRLGVSNGHTTDGTEKPSKDGAAFLAVGRGKVGAGLPVIATMNRIISSGDLVHRIMGSLSGYLSAEDGKPFSKVVNSAEALDYTEVEALYAEECLLADSIRETRMSRGFGLKRDHRCVNIEHLIFCAALQQKMLGPGVMQLYLQLCLQLVSVYKVLNSS